MADMAAGRSAGNHGKRRRFESMPRDMNDPTAAISSILSEADELICRQIKESRLMVSPILAFVMPDRKASCILA
ncbi:hypothetical protein RSO01_91290 [Reyranella soli]|uniref:Uncharacterized protein n=1 Tax=Reyranella soli TaxID=1230389 RepID=A0A512NSN5_9HYPH|nr:hypothetical protein RSO01_91290 [Reyranella soli]